MVVPTATNSYSGAQKAKANEYEEEQAQEQWHQHYRGE
jgi:hypothetical protein